MRTIRLASSCLILLACTAPSEISERSVATSVDRAARTITVANVGSRKLAVGIRGQNELVYSLFAACGHELSPAIVRPGKATTFDIPPNEANVIVYFCAPPRSTDPVDAPIETHIVVPVS